MQLLATVSAAQFPEAQTGYGWGNPASIEVLPSQIEVIANASRLDRCQFFEPIISVDPLVSRATMVVPASQATHTVDAEEVVYYSTFSSAECTCAAGFDGKAKSTRQVYLDDWFANTPPTPAQTAELHTQIIVGVSNPLDARPNHCYHADNEFATNAEGRPDYTAINAPFAADWCPVSTTWFDCMDKPELVQVMSVRLSTVKMTSVTGTPTESFSHGIGPPLWALGSAPIIKVHDGHGHKCNFDAGYQRGLVAAISNVTGVQYAFGHVTDFLDGRVPLSGTCLSTGDWDLPFTYLSGVKQSTQQGCSSSRGSGGEALQVGSKIAVRSVDMQQHAVDCQIAKVSVSSATGLAWELCTDARTGSRIARHKRTVYVDVADYSNYTHPAEIIPSPNMQYCLDNWMDPLRGCVSSTCSSEPTALSICYGPGGEPFTCDGTVGALADPLMETTVPGCNTPGFMLPNGLYLVATTRARRGALENSVSLLAGGVVHLAEIQRDALILASQQATKISNAFVNFAASASVTLPEFSLAKDHHNSKRIAEMYAASRSQALSGGGQALQDQLNSIDLTSSDTRRYGQTAAICLERVTVGLYAGEEYCQQSPTSWVECCRDYDDAGRPVVTGFGLCTYSANRDSATGQWVKSELAIETKRKAKDFYQKSQVLEKERKALVVAKDSAGLKENAAAYDVLLQENFRVLAVVGGFKASAVSAAQASSNPPAQDSFDASDVGSWFGSFGSFFPALGLGLVIWVLIFYVLYRAVMAVFNKREQRKRRRESDDDVERPPKRSPPPPPTKATPTIVVTDYSHLSGRDEPARRNSGLYMDLSGTNTLPRRPKRPLSRTGTFAVHRVAPKIPGLAAMVRVFRLGAVRSNRYLSIYRLDVTLGLANIIKSNAVFLEHLVDDFGAFVYCKVSLLLTHDVVSDTTLLGALSHDVFVHYMFTPYVSTFADLAYRPECHLRTEIHEQNLKNFLSNAEPHSSDEDEEPTYTRALSSADNIS